MGKIDAADLKDLLNDTTRKLKSTQNNIETNTIIEKLISSAMDSEFSTLWFFDEEKVVLLRERSTESVREISMLSQHGVLAKCFLTMSGGIYNYLASEKEYLQEIDNPDEIRMKSKIIIPLIDDERLVGLATAYSSVQNIKNFDEDDMEIFKAMSPYLIDVIYSMYPKLRANNFQRVIIGERLLDNSHNVVKNIAKIQEVQQGTETSDATLNFLSNTVHDIRTPANTLYGFLELLEGQLDNPRLLQYIQNAKESAQFINELTTSILDRVSTQRERSKAEPVQINPTKFFASVTEIFSANMFNKKITYNVYIDPSIPKEIVIEEVMLKRIVMNLIGNAYKFTPSEKSITFSVEYLKAKQELSVSIKDTGIGIAKEKQEEIFKAFSQAEDDTNLQYGGTGLGLSISVQYVQELGGELKLESELEKGSNFHFNIPINIVNKVEAFKSIQNKSIKLDILLENKNILTAKNLMKYMLKMGLLNEKINPIRNISKVSEDITHLICFQDQLNDAILTYTQDNKIELLVVEESFLSLIQNEDSHYSIISQYGYYANTLHTFLSNKVVTKILIVDDDKINIHLIKAILDEDFCQIETAMDGKTALTMLLDAVKKEEPFSMVYLDNHMPNLTGMEVITQFRSFEKQKRLDAIFAVFISGDSVSESSKSDMFNAYVGKPFNKNKIKATLSEAMGRK